MICEDLTRAEANAVLARAYDDRTSDDWLLAQHAREFFEAWLTHSLSGDALLAMIWAMNQEHLVYRLHLIPLLPDWRLFGLPATT